MTELPAEFRSRANTLPVKDKDKEEVDENHYRCRRFDVSSKGKVHNRGDSVKPRASNTSLNKAGVEEQPVDGPIYKNERLLSVCSALSSRGSPDSRQSSTESPAENISTYRVHVCGFEGVGKTSLVTQFLSSDQINVFEGFSGGTYVAHNKNCLMLSKEFLKNILGFWTQNQKHLSRFSFI